MAALLQAAGFSLADLHARYLPGPRPFTTGARRCRFEGQVRWQMSWLGPQALPGYLAGLSRKSTTIVAMARVPTISAGSYTMNFGLWLGAAVAGS